MTDSDVDDRALAGAAPAQEQVFRMIFSASVVQMLRCLALYSFADHLAAGPKTAEELAGAENLNLDATQRLMRAAVAFALMTAEPDGRFGTTPMLATLEKTGPRSLRDLAISQGGHGVWTTVGRMDQSLMTGEPQAQASLGMSLWEYFASPPGAVEGAATAKLMAAAFAPVDQAAADYLDTRGLGVVADIGGAEGSLLRALMHDNPDLHGVLLDLPHVAESAGRHDDNVALGDRLTIRGGSFFEDVPEADLYCLRVVLHDWSDEHCLKILRQCRKAARIGARLVLIENVVAEGPLPSYTAQLDLIMMVQLGGRERTLEEFGRLLEQSGFRIESTAGLCPPFSIIEAVAV
jgi:hypothetical protein